TLRAVQRQVAVAASEQRVALGRAHAAIEQVDVGVPGRGLAKLLEMVDGVTGEAALQQQRSPRPWREGLLEGIHGADRILTGADAVEVEQIEEEKGVLGDAVVRALQRRAAVDADREPNLRDRRGRDRRERLRHISRWRPDLIEQL